MKGKLLSLTILLSIIQILNVSGQIVPSRQWPVYRGYLSSGVLDNANLPDLFNLPLMTNVRWKIMIPGLGLSSPVICCRKEIIAIFNQEKIV